MAWGFGYGYSDTRITPPEFFVQCEICSCILTEDDYAEECLCQWCYDEQLAEEIAFQHQDRINTLVSRTRSLVTPQRKRGWK